MTPEAALDAVVSAAPSGSSSTHEIGWTLGLDWFVAVGALHVLIAITLGALVSPWWVVICATSWCFKVHGARRDENYVLLAFEDGIEVRRDDAVLRLSGTCWLSERWLVIPTVARVLPVRCGRLSAQDFARLRRAALAAGCKTSNGSTAG